MAHTRHRTTIGAKSSFKPEVRARTSQYRTPSPPPVDVYEPISPIIQAAQRGANAWLGPLVAPGYAADIRRLSGHSATANGWHSNHTSPYVQTSEAFPTSHYQHHSPQMQTSRGSQTPLDVFATLATSPALSSASYLRPSGQHFNIHPASHSPNNFNRTSFDGERPSKRIRQDNTLGDSGQAVYQHASTFNPISPTQVAVEDAELLLGLWNPPRTTPKHEPAAQSLTAPSQIPALPKSPPRIEPLQISKVEEETQSPEVDAEAAPSVIPGESREEQLAGNALSAGDTDAQASSIADGNDTTRGSSEQKTRVYKGWPKGKPRGPRQAPYAKRGTKVGTKKSQTDGGTGQGSASGSTGSPAPSGADMSMEYLVENADGENLSVNSMQQYQELSADMDGDAKVPGTSEDTASGKPAPPSSAQHGRTRSPHKQTAKDTSEDLCAACQNTRTSDLQDFWISCNGCKSWFHHTCVGFHSEREVKDVDKFYCKVCEAQFGATTFVRKSARAHAAIDYARLNQGEIRTSTDILDHHYVKMIQEGKISIQPESFPRMPPELVTAQYFERVGTMSEPVVIPAWMNPRPHHPESPYAALTTAPNHEANPDTGVPTTTDGAETPLGAVEELSKDFEYDYVPDVGQDKLDMVIPQGLTVRMVAELYGPDEKVEVIDVKNQEGEEKRWNLRQWADYYEATGQKPVRNVISLEISQSKLGRLIRRPKIVRDLDLQDSVWPPEEQAKGIFPKVQFYCLMSVAHCYTDFHIDFGGSSVYYHILQGQKTFFFIPPKKEHLKKYEEWCLSSDQNSIFLGDWTKECYRVDLSAGDTMLIPSGWIHAVWTPVDTLVIGGNFLTRMHYGMQIQINEIEKNTGVGRKFRYPHFQKVLWYTVIRYLERDPLPSSVAQTLLSHQKFERKHPVWYDFEAGEYLEPVVPEVYNDRYYSKGEIDGLPDLIRYIFRTVMISMGKVQGITKTTQEAVMRSLPKGYGDHLELAQTFAMWSAWKRGNEELPAWAYPNAIIADVDNGAADKKLSAATLKRIERQTIKDAIGNDRRLSVRHASTPAGAAKEASVQPEASDVAGSLQEERAAIADPVREAVSGPKRACDACRKRRIRCKHRGDEEPLPDLAKRFGIKMSHAISPLEQSQPAGMSMPLNEPDKQDESSGATSNHFPQAVPPIAPIAPMASMVIAEDSQTSTPAKSVDEKTTSPSSAETSAARRPRTKACDDCRKSKRRCIHDENGQIDPVKAQEAPVSRSSMPGAKRKGDTDSTLISKKVKRESDASDSAGAAFATDAFTDGTSFANVKDDLNNRPLIEHADMSHISADRQLTSNSVLGQAHPTSSIMTTTTSIPTTQSADPTSILARTPSLHLQTTATTTTETSKSTTVSTSPPTSPLSDLNPSSPLLNNQGAAAAEVQDEFVPLRTPRQRKQVDRFSMATFEAPAQTPKAPLSARRASSTPRGLSTTTEKDNFIKPAPSVRKSSGPGSSRSVSREKSTGVGVPVLASPSSARKERAMSAEELQEEVNLRLARELSGADWGLRRRS